MLSRHQYVWIEARTLWSPIVCIYEVCTWICVMTGFALNHFVCHSGANIRSQKSVLLRVCVCMHVAERHTTHHNQFWVRWIGMFAALDRCRCRRRRCRRLHTPKVIANMHTYALNTHVHVYNIRNCAVCMNMSMTWGFRERQHRRQIYECIVPSIYVCKHQPHAITIARQTHAARYIQHIWTTPKCTQTHTYIWGIIRNQADK